MGFTAVALAVGLALGLGFGGRPADLAERPIRWWGALPVGVVLQAIPEVIGMSDRAGFALVLASYVVLVAFAVANLRLVGMSVALVGLAANALVITVNGGMPVRASAVVAAGAEPDEVARLDFGAKRHLEDDDDRLTFLADIVPVPLFREVLSFGDLILAVGVADVVFRLLRPPGDRRVEKSSNKPSRPVTARR